MGNSISYPSYKKNEALQDKPYVVIPFLALSLLIAIILLNNLNVLYSPTTLYYNKLISIEYVIENNTLILDITNNSNNTIVVKEIIVDTGNSRFRETINAKVDPSNTFTITCNIKELERLLNSQSKNSLGKIIVVTIIYEWCGGTYSQRIFIPVIKK